MVDDLLAPFKNQKYIHRVVERNLLWDVLHIVLLFESDYARSNNTRFIIGLMLFCLTAVVIE